MCCEESRLETWAESVALGGWGVSGLVNLGGGAQCERWDMWLDRRAW